MNQRRIPMRISEFDSVMSFLFAGSVVIISLDGTGAVDAVQSLSYVIMVMSIRPGRNLYHVQTSLKSDDVMGATFG